MACSDEKAMLQQLCQSCSEDKSEITLVSIKLLLTYNKVTNLRDSAAKDLYYYMIISRSEIRLWMISLGIFLTSES